MALYEVELPGDADEARVAPIDELNRIVLDGIVTAYRIEEVIPEPIPEPPPPSDNYPIEYFAALPEAPRSTRVVTPAEGETYFVSSSDITVELRNNVRSIVFARNIQRVAIVGAGGTLGNLSTPPYVSDAPEDLTIRNVHFIGAGVADDISGWSAMQLCGRRILIEDCTSIAASPETWGGSLTTTEISMNRPVATADGIGRYCIFAHPGTTDVTVRRCNFATMGAEACLRFMGCQRVNVMDNALHVSSWKHTFRWHGREDNVPGDYLLFIRNNCVNRGVWFGYARDRESRATELVRNVIAERNNVSINRDGNGNAGALLVGHHGALRYFTCRYNNFTDTMRSDGGMEQFAPTETEWVVSPNQWNVTT